MEIRSDAIQDAVKGIERRAEREADFRKLYDIYVDRGVLRSLTPNTNQIILGRRGVGKTHLLHYYQDHVLTRPKPVLFQLHDCRKLGSGLASVSESPVSIAINMFTEFLNNVASAAFDSLDTIEGGAPEDAGLAVLAFQDTISRPGRAGSLLDFTNLGNTLDRFRAACEKESLILALDEWVSIPLQAQPYFAEYLKRTFFTNPCICCKIGTVTYQTRMSAQTKHGTIGLESGADVFSDINLDNYFVWEEDQPGVQDFFAQALYNHLAEGVGWDLDIDPSRKQAQVVSTFFTQENIFIELCRAAEGNCRDFLNVFRLAYQDFYRDHNANRIGIRNLNTAAEAWYQQDKLRNLGEESNLEEFLNHLIQNVIRKRKSKTFMVSYRDISHPLLARLFSARLLHPLRTTWTHPDRPGEPYHLVTIDYGCYRALRNTRAEPSQLVFFSTGSEEHDDLVPLDDRRSIRRIALERETLNRVAPGWGHA